jgi:hypothetical protein
MKVIQLKSTITCSECGFTKEETMPEDAFTFFYDAKDVKLYLKGLLYLLLKRNGEMPSYANGQ